MQDLAEIGLSLAKPELEAFQIAPEGIDSFWEDLQPFFEKALIWNRGEFGLEDLYGRLKKGFMQVFMVQENGEIKLVLVTEFVQYPQYSTVRICLAAGEELKKAEKFYSYFANWALMNGAIEIEAMVRPSMARLLRSFGFKESRIEVRKDLRNIVH